jgi:hypothetical protein
MGCRPSYPNLPQNLPQGLVQEQHDARGGGVVEEILGQVEDALDEVLVDEPLADGLFLVGAGIARAAGGGAGVEDDGGAALGVEAGVHVLDPAPVGGGFAGKAGTGGKALEFIGVVVGLGEPVLVLLNFFFTATYLVLPSTHLLILDVLNELFDMHSGANPRESPL